MFKFTTKKRFFYYFLYVFPTLAFTLIYYICGKISMPGKSFER